MKVRRVSDECRNTNCPTVYLADDGTAVFQGEPVDSADGMQLGPGETAVKLPIDVVMNALSALSQGQQA